MYGDDLYIYKNHEGLKSFSDKISIPVVFDKYRPIHGLGMHFLIELFHKHTGGYYAFNVAVQVANTFLFAFIVNLFVRSYLLSLLAGLIVGLSRFAYFNITQLLNGGALEGLAMSFFLVTIFFLIKSSIGDGIIKERRRNVLLSILFANAAMYTHERYIVLLPFIALMVLLYPGFRQLGSKRKMIVCILSLVSILVNVVLKKIIYGMPFFVGTAGTNISFSFSSALSFFADAVLSVFQFNKGPEYLVGIKFTDLPFFDKILVAVFFTGVIATLVIFIRDTKNAFASRNTERINQFWLFVFLLILFGLCLVPAVVTIRLEQRWLQASYAILVFALIVAFNNLSFSNGNKRIVLPFFFILLLWIDFNYLKKGANNIYITYSQKMATEFERAINNGIIRPGINNIYIWEKQRDANSERAINWDLAEGYFFEFYQKQHKNVFYIDSNYLNKDTINDTTLKRFNASTDQVINLENGIIDITNDYLQRSPKYFSHSKNTVIGDSSQYFTKRLLISAPDLSRFQTTGFYDNENTIRWTNGNATIALFENNIVKDSLTLVLNTYLPPVARKIIPKITLQTISGRDCQPFFSSKDADKFTFRFYFPELTGIQKINIISDVLPPTPPDQRVLSFPFVSLEIHR